MAATLGERRRKEIDALQQRGKIKPEDVVSFAKSHKDSALHSYFDWNVEKAAQQHWLEQARHLIRVYVTIVPNTNKTIRVYASLPGDRQQPGGGYRSMKTVLGNAELREQLLLNAFEDFQRWRIRYETLRELTPIFSAAEKVLRRKKSKAS